ncbi:hypothetical protein GE061_019037 [Apolygus lucorum]|uniref:Uncharacterized protein n=1 Tax=Apolygus lucorum TaxID=248454 RepID=A0A6A4JFB3_APOLU|nr:hypothetical protein GE061_019037 [Apolygus lucorum]
MTALSFAIFLLLFTSCLTASFKKFYPELTEDEKHYLHDQVNEGQSQWHGPPETHPRVQYIYNGNVNVSGDSYSVTTIYDFWFLSETRGKCNGRLKYVQLHRKGHVRATETYHVRSCQK